MAHHRAALTNQLSTPQDVEGRAAAARRLSASESFPSNLFFEPQRETEGGIETRESEPMTPTVIVLQQTLRPVIAQHHLLSFFSLFCDYDTFSCSK